MSWDELQGEKYHAVVLSTQQDPCAAIDEVIGSCAKSLDELVAASDHLRGLAHGDGARGERTHQNG